LRSAERAISHKSSDLVVQTFRAENGDTRKWGSTTAALLSPEAGIWISLSGLMGVVQEGRPIRRSTAKEIGTRPEVETMMR
jgi:hypothetical protein